MPSCIYAISFCPPCAADLASRCSRPCSSGGALCGRPPPRRAAARESRIAGFVLWKTSAGSFGLPCFRSSGCQPSCSPGSSSSPFRPRMIGARGGGMEGLAFGRLPRGGRKTLWRPAEQTSLLVKIRPIAPRCGKARRCAPPGCRPAKGDESSRAERRSRPRTPGEKPPIGLVRDK